MLLVVGCGNMTLPTPGGCSVVKADGKATITCTDGTTASVSDGVNGLQGVVGPSGPVGLTGNSGPQGMAGSAGTIITPVQFCPNITTYPTTFSEIGFCMDGNLYGVYSLNNGFLVYLPPGAYTSNGVNSSCNFTVLANCVVQ